MDPNDPACEVGASPQPACSFLGQEQRCVFPTPWMSPQGTVGLGEEREAQQGQGGRT